MQLKISTKFGENLKNRTEKCLKILLNYPPWLEKPSKNELRPSGLINRENSGYANLPQFLNRYADRFATTRRRSLSKLTRIPAWYLM